MMCLIETERFGIVAEQNTVQGFKKAVEAFLKQDNQFVQQNLIKAIKKFAGNDRRKY